MISVRKRSDSNKCFLCESKATATNVFCAKAKRQQRMFSVRKQSDSNKCFLCESKATATNDFCAKAKRQQQLRQGEIVILGIITCHFSLYLMES
ncbi:hypothetical protein [Lysinibacillus xylanilyticus]|uniref:hypothetical protein n=1 Tax=Lysinibacillus xylanilyticus TaxID=582475 RepID=UPI003CFEFA73